ncbi:MAG: endolytic transglycosylase MltG [Bdellovibrionales bacterium]
MKKKVGVFLFSFLLFGAALGLVAYMLSRQFLFQGSEPQGRDVIYEIRQGQNFHAIARDLQKMRVLKSAEAFAVYARLTRQIPNVKAGEYRFNTAMTPPEVMAVMTSGQSVTRSITIPEGYSVFEIADLLESKGFAKREEILRLAFDRAFVKKLLGEYYSSLEGYLYPETYSFTKYMGPEKILSEMVRLFFVNFEQVPKPFPFSWNRHQVVTMASLIEKETGAPHERQLISSVFTNRLRKNMRLQTDPTIIYAKALQVGRIVIDIRKSDLTMNHPYNTYMKSGLPPGPIASPGKDALRAAVNPAISDFLFFVSQNDGTHIFSETYEKHANAVRRFQMDRRAREGKSWRDLNKATEGRP